MIGVYGFTRHTLTGERCGCSIMLSSTVVIILFTVLLIGGTDAISFKDIRKKIDQGVGFANELLGENGEVRQ